MGYSGLATALQSRAVICIFYAFSILGFLFEAGRGPLPARKFYPAIYVYAFVIEMLQFLNPNRTVDIYDLIQNIIGVTFGILCWRIFAWYLRTRKSKQTDEQPIIIPLRIAADGNLAPNPVEGE